MKKFLTNNRILELFKTENNEEIRKSVLEKKNLLFAKLEPKDKIKKTASVMIDDFNLQCGNFDKDSVVSKEIEQQSEFFKSRLKSKIQRIRTRKNFYLKNKSSRKKKEETEHFDFRILIKW